MLFSDKLKLLRKEHGLTQEELASKLNVSRQAITKWETGEGLPDIDNLKEISILFKVSIDELIKEELMVNKTTKTFSYFEEIEIDHHKHFDIDFPIINELNIIGNSEEKVRVELLSCDEIEGNYKIIFDNLYNRLDINIKSKKKTSALIVNLSIPEKYLDEMELKAKIKTLNILGINIPKLEYDGDLKYLNISSSKGDITLNTTKSDVEIDYDKLDGKLELNTINSISQLKVPKDTKYKTVLKGIKNTFTNDKSIDDASNIIELNGMNSKLFIIEKE